MIRAVIFDMDGTLIDTEKHYMQYWMNILQDQGYKLPYSQALKLRGLGKSRVKDMFRSLYGIEFDYDRASARIKALLEEEINRNGLEKKAGADELLAYLRKAGYKTAVATSTAYERACYLLDQVGLREQFDSIISADKVKNGKPSPDIYLYACDQLKESPFDCIAVEDAPNGVLSGARAGCRVVMVPDLSEPDEELSGMLFARADSLEKIIHILESGEGAHG